jgi:hypothetical protein
MSAHQSLPVLDSKTRRKLEEQRRMAYRRAIEAHAEQRRLNAQLSDFPELIAASYLQIAGSALSR